MAAVTKPIALDESFKSTEQTPRNIADVLAEELSNIAQSIGAINQKYKIVQTLPDTDISTTAIYLVPKSTAQTDNTYDEYINLTGTSLGWEKIGDTEIDLSDYYTESEVDTLLAEKADVSDIPVLPTTDEQTSTTGEFETVTGGLLSECIVSIEPVQDLHGYSKPWVGGAGKNLIDLQGKYSSFISGDTSLLSAGEYYVYIFTEDNISSYNSLVSYSTDGNTFTGITTTDDGTAVCDTRMEYNRKKCHITLHQNAYLRQGLQINANVSGKQIYVMITEDGTNYSSIANVPPYSEVNNIWQPYENICPISGHTQSDVYVVGKNRLPLPVAETKNGVTLTHNSDGSITLTGTASANTYFDFFPNGDFNSSKYSGYKVYLKNSGVSPSVDTVAFRISGSDRVSLQSITYDGTVVNTSEDGLYFAIRVQGGYDTNGCTFKPMMIAPDETDSTFEPYKGKTYSTPFGQTVYGGTLDVLTGELTIDRTLTTLNGSESYEANTRDGYTIYNILPSAGTGIVTECNEFDFVTINSGLTGVVLGNNNRHLYFININGNVSGVSDVASWKTWLSNNPCQITVPLATPQTIQLTPQQIISLVGKNYVDAPLDGQSIVEVKFKQLMTIDDVLALIGG